MIAILVTVVLIKY